MSGIDTFLVSEFAPWPYWTGMSQRTSLTTDADEFLLFLNSFLD